MRLRPRRLAGVLLGAAGAVLALGSSTTQAGWTAATVGNSTSTAQAGSMSVVHSYASTTCSTGARVTAVTCAPTLGTQASPPASTADSITNNGDGAVNQTVRGVSCGPVQLANARAGTDPMLPRNAVAFRLADPWGTSSAVGLSGSGYATDIVGTTGSGLLGALQNSNSIGVWFRADDASGGGLISLDASLSNATSATGDPMLWLDTSGRVRFAASGTLGPIQGASTHTFTSGWHLAVLTANTTGVLTLTKALTLYVDGVQEATGSGLTLLTGISGYWHLGWADFTGLSAPTSPYFHGSLAGAFVNPTTALSAAQVSSLYGQASAASYSSTAGTQGAGSLWMLGDDGITTYGGALPGAEATPCSKVNLTLTFTNPAATIGPMALSSFADGTTRAAGSLPAGQTRGLTLATGQGAGYANDLRGLHLSVPLVFTYTYGATTWVQTMDWSGDPGEVFWG